MTNISDYTGSTEGPDGDITIDEYFRTVRPDARVRNALRRAGVTTMARLCEMTDAERASYSNLVLMCYPHHKETRLMMYSE